MAWISCSYILFHRGTRHTSINQCSMRQRKQKLWEWKLTKVSGDSLKLAQGCTSICGQEHLIITSELNQKMQQLWSWYLNCAYSHHLHELGQITAIVHLQLLSGSVIYHTEAQNKNRSTEFSLPGSCQPRQDSMCSIRYPPHASFKLISSDHFLLKGHTVPVYLNYAKVSITFLSHGQYSNELRSKLNSYHLLRKAKKSSHCQLWPC